MIQANELRIGNWILDDGEPVQVTKIAMDYIEGKKGEGLTGYIDLAPIALTPEILENTGFKKDSNYLMSTYYDLDDGTYVKFDKKGEVQHLGVGHYAIDQGLCKSLHQLQNMYFILMGKELPVNKVTPLSPTNKQTPSN